VGFLFYYFIEKFFLMGRMCSRLGIAPNGCLSLQALRWKGKGARQRWDGGSGIAFVIMGGGGPSSRRRGLCVLLGVQDGGVAVLADG